VILNQGAGRQTLKDLVPLKDGKATHTDTLLPKGSHLLDVTYKPDTQNVIASQSDPVPHEIEQDEKGEDKEVAKRIVEKLNENDAAGIDEEVKKLLFRPMRRLLNVMALLQKAGKLEAFLNRLTSERPENERLVVAIFTIQRQFTRQWFKLFEKASESDRKALLTRTPEKVKAAFELENEPSDPPDPQDEPDDPNANIVIEPGISTTAKLAFESKQFGGFGSTEFEVKIGPNGRMKSVELDMTIVKKKLEKVTGLGPVLDLEGKLSLNAEAEFEKNDRRVVVKEVQAAVKGEVQVTFPEIKVLKNVVFSLSAKFNKDGEFEAEAAVLIPIPGT
jgi:hypothetical protein